LLLSANDNWQILQPTTPAQYFHALRRQALRHWRKPLVVLTPKSMLRHPEAVSAIADFSSGTFQGVLPERSTSVNPDSVQQILLCSGKIYFELLEERQKLKQTETAIVRIEQLYPLPEAQLFDILAQYPESASAIWVQEEPINMGAWQYLRMQLGETLGKRTWSCLARPAASSPAAGSPRLHRQGQQELIAAALSSAVASSASPLNMNA
jgi:2-oxoglutarate dehydrogenase E1 component